MLFSMSIVVNFDIYFITNVVYYYENDKLRCTVHFKGWKIKGKILENTDIPNNLIILQGDSIEKVIEKFINQK